MHSFFVLILRYLKGVVCIFLRSTSEDLLARESACESA